MPPLPFLPSGGPGGRQEDGVGGRAPLVHSSSRVRSRFSLCLRLYAGLRLHAGRRLYAGREMPGLRARIWHCLVSLLLVAALPWSEPVVTRWGAPETSNNKRAAVVELGVWVPLLDLVVAVAEDGEGWSSLKLPGDLLLQVGDHHMTATICRHDLWLRRQPF